MPLMFKKGSKKAIIFMAVIGLLIFFHASGIMRPAESALIYALNPFFRKVYDLSSGLRAIYNDQAAKIDWQNKIRELDDRVITLTEENTKLKMVEEENKLLREHLLFLAKNKYRYVISNVISRGDLSDTLSKTETIIIDKGKNDGIYEGLGIVSHQGVIVGKVVEAKDNIAKVYLTNNSRCKLAATILNEDKTSGITEGELGLTIRMGFIPQDRNIVTGDVVVTSGLEESIPRGLVIGRVIGVSRESNELWQTATIEPLVSSEDLVIVSVLLP
jgi:rod shape-determining protein MreC